MPSREDHLRQAQHNREFSESLDPASYPDWLATGLFYTALHYIDAFLATKSIHPGKHDVRDRCVARVQELRPLHDHYRALKDSSRTARYYPSTSFSLAHLQSLRNIHLERIRVGLRPYILIP
jgi:hypothetical protein